MTLQDSVMEPSVSIIIPNYNGGRIAVKCVESLLQTDYSNMTIQFVDNCSTDNSRTEIERRFGKDTRLKISSLDRNYSYTGAISIGFQADESEYVVLMNNDTIADRRWLKELVKAYQAHPMMGAVQAKLLRMDNPTILQYGGGLINRLGFMSGRGVGKPKVLYCSNDRIFFAAGACLLTSRKVLTQVGLPDTRFLMYDDADLGWRMRLRGLEVVFVPTSRVMHRGSMTLARPEFEEKTLSQSVYEQCAMLLTNYSVRMIFVTLPWILLWYSLRGIVYVARGQPRLARSTVVGMIRLLRQLRMTWQKRRFVQTLVRRVSDSQIISLMQGLGCDPMVIAERGIVESLELELLS